MYVCVRACAHVHVCVYERERGTEYIRIYNMKILGRSLVRERGNFL